MMGRQENKDFRNRLVLHSKNNKKIYQIWKNKENKRKEILITGMTKCPENTTHKGLEQIVIKDGPLR